MEVAGTAGGWQEAVNMSKQHRPHVILMDINMPDMDGITATEIISNTVPESPIIMMSVQGEQDYLRRSMLAGAREFLVKPFSADELVNAIRHVNELEKMKRSRYQQQAPQQQPAGPAAVPAQPPGGQQKGQIILCYTPESGLRITKVTIILAVAFTQSMNKLFVHVDSRQPFVDVVVIPKNPPKAKMFADLV